MMHHVVLTKMLSLKRGVGTDSTISHVAHLAKVSIVAELARVAVGGDAATFVVLIGSAVGLGVLLVTASIFRVVPATTLVSTAMVTQIVVV